MRFPTDVPVKLVMLGTGRDRRARRPPPLPAAARIEPARTVYPLRRGPGGSEKPYPTEFAPADLGQNKARVLAERYASVFGMKAEYVPSFVETREELMRLIRPGIWEIKEGPYLYKLKREMVLLLGCVDNNKSRRLCHEAFCQSQDLVYIDSGNEEFSGQVVCGVRRNGRTIFKPVGGIAPEILKAQDRFPSEISCAEAAQADPQSMAANIMAATVMVDMVYNILAHGRSRVRVTEFSTQTAKNANNFRKCKEGGSMKTIVDAKPFSDALANACTVPRKSRIPCLNEVYVHAYPDKCILAATDLTTWFITEIPAQGDEFSFIFPEAALRRKPAGTSAENWSWSMTCWRTKSVPAPGSPCEMAPGPANLKPVPERTTPICPMRTAPLCFLFRPAGLWTGSSAPDMRPRSLRPMPGQSAAASSSAATVFCPGRPPDGMGHR